MRRTELILGTQDLTRARDIYKACLKLIPHKRFSFAKVWTQYAEFEIRQLELDTARKIMGTGIGLAPKEKVRRLTACGVLDRS